MKKWADLVSIGTANAMSGLSQMIGQDIDVRSFELERVPVASIAKLVGGADAQSVGIYLTVTGEADGHLMLIFEPQIAFAFVDLLMMQPPDSTREVTPMAASALGEMGNVIGAFFLNAIADATGLSLRPSPPLGDDRYGRRASGCGHCRHLALQRRHLPRQHDLLDE